MASAQTPQDGLYDSKGPSVIVVITIMPTLALIVVTARFWTRAIIVRNLAWDDWLAALAMIMSIAVSICMGFQVKNGMGRHMQTLTLQQGIDSLKALFASIIAYNLGLTFTKLSILMQYRRICSSRSIMRIIHLLMGCVVLYGFWTVLSAIFNCVPVAKFWDDRIAGHCINKQFLWFLNAGINIATDFTLVALPFVLLKNLMLPKRQKYSLIAILGLGGFASIVSILRLWALYILSVSKDVTWENPGTAIWSNVELNTGVICASLPALRALVSRYFPSLFPSRISGSNRRTGESSTGSRSRRTSKKFSKISSMGRKGPTSSGFGTLSDDDDRWGEFRNGKADLESASERSPDSVHLVPLSARGAAMGRPDTSDEKGVEAYVHAFNDIGLTAPSSHHTRNSSSHTFDSDRISTPPADGIRVIRSMRQTIEDRPAKANISPSQRSDCVALVGTGTSEK